MHYYVDYNQRYYRRLTCLFFRDHCIRVVFAVDEPVDQRDDEQADGCTDEHG